MCDPPQARNATAGAPLAHKQCSAGVRTGRSPLDRHSRDVQPCASHKFGEPTSVSPTAPQPKKGPPSAPAGAKGSPSAPAGALVCDPPQARNAIAGAPLAHKQCSAGVRTERSPLDRHSRDVQPCASHRGGRRWCRQPPLNKVLAPVGASRRRNQSSSHQATR
jgi:hypothetical protein